jgi:hypothetical protein
MRRRNLDHHVLVSKGNGDYFLLDHPEVTVERYTSASFRGWQVCFNGMAQRDHVERDLESVDRALLRFGDCKDCGKFCRREGHPPSRCPSCHVAFRREKERYDAAAMVARLVDITWRDYDLIRSFPTTRAAVEAALAVRVTIRT